MPPRPSLLLLEQRHAPGRSFLSRLAVTYTLLLGVAGAASSSSAATPPSQAAQAAPASEASRQQTVVLGPEAQAQAQVAVELVRPFGVDTALSTVGRVTYADNLVNHVTSPVSGQVRKIFAQPGKAVQKGEPLAVIDSPDVGQARADLQKARAGLAATDQGLARQTSLFRAHACSERDLEMARDASRRARAELARARTKWDLLGGGDTQAAGELFTLRAPLAGLVLERRVSLGDEVQGQFDAGSSGDLFVLANLDTVWVLADVHESDLGRVSVGAQALILRDQGVVAAQADAAPLLTGRVEWLSEVLDSNVRTAKVRCAYDNRERKLAPNTFVTLRISALGRDALTVPEASILSVSGQTFVFVAGGKTGRGAVPYTLRPVEVDYDHDADIVRVPVFHGLQEGEQVVVKGMDALMQALLQKQKGVAG